jgi:hypothetical protein
MPYSVIEAEDQAPRPFVPAPILGTSPPATYYGSGFNNIKVVVPGPVMAIESYPQGADTGQTTTDSPYQTPPAQGSSTTPFYKNGGSIVSPPNPVQVFSSFEPNEQGTGGPPGPIEPDDVG